MAYAVSKHEACVGGLSDIGVGQPAARSGESAHAPEYVVHDIFGEM
jgi:hypothetical protein